MQAGSKVASIGATRPVEFRIESASPISGSWWPRPGERQLVLTDRALAVALAAKGQTQPLAEIRVIHVPSGEVVFRKPGA